MDLKREAKPLCRPKWNMTKDDTITAIVDGTLFGMTECDVRVPDDLREHFAEMQPIFKNAKVTLDDVGPYMRQFAEEHSILANPRRMLVGSYRGDETLLATTPLMRWYLVHSSSTASTKYSNAKRTPAFDALASQYPQPGAQVTRIQTKPSLLIP